MGKKNRISSKNKQLESQQKKDEFRQAALEKAKQEQQMLIEQEQRAEEQKREKILEEVGERLPVQAPRKKSSAKAAGLKSALVLQPGKILVTSFGKGSEAIPQMEITFRKEGENVLHSEKDMCEDEQRVLRLADSQKLQKKQLQMIGRGDIRANIDNPIFRCKGVKYQHTRPAVNALEGVRTSTDLIGAKAALEKRYFDTDAPFDDNIHIQMIHAIQDIEKIVALYATEIVYTLNNILGKESKGQAVDLIGMMSLDKTYQQFMSPYTKPDKKTSAEINKENFEDLLSRKQLMYFGNVIPHPTRDEKGNISELTDKQKEEAYLILATLGSIRQATTHGGERNADTLFSLGIKKNGCREDAVALLQRQYSHRVEQLNRSFAEHAYKDVNIICKVLQISSDKEKEQIIREYYNFIIRKTYKSLGFSIKALREVLGAMDEFQWMNDKKYDSVRRKLNHIVDFLIVRYFSEHEKEADHLVNCLRACGADSKEKTEEDKNREKKAQYVDQALRMKHDDDFIRWMGETLQNSVLGDAIKNMPGLDKTSSERKIWENALSSEQLETSAQVFSTLLYLLARFLDGKEINELLTKIANRLDNIASFLEVAEKCHISISFRENYQMFKNSRKIAEEIRVINSFACMTDEMANVPKVLMEDAVVLLGLSKEEGAAEYAKRIMEEKHEFRNFLINNVIQSSRFQYLVRYSNPKNVRMLANILVREGNPVLKFILKRIPRSQLIRYYESCTGEMDGEQKQGDELIESLARIIREVDIRKYETVRNSNKISSEEKIRKERTKNILGLYLTVLFLLQKNLTNVNARYIIAFHCFERDAFLLLQDWMNNEREDSRLANSSKACMELLTGTKKVDDKNQKKLLKGEGMIEFTRLFYSRKSIRYKKRVKEYVDQNINNACKGSILSFRNNVAHLNVIRNSAKWMDGIRKVDSYFELYHYMMQKCLLEEHKKNSGKEWYVEPNEETVGYFAMFEKYGTYCKDYVKALNVPFAYNLPRYKNLSINELFDQNDYLPDKAKRWDICDE